MPNRSVLTIGNFDGVHLGHRAILDQARALADARHARVIALTFDPHPAAVLRPGSQPPVLSTIAHRVEQLMDAGADQVHLLKPTPDLLSHPPAAFIERLVDEFAPTAIVEGPDFRFGKDRAGDIQTLRQLGRHHQFDVQVVAGIEVGLCDRLQTPVSSSLIRWLIGRGRVADAARCLGRPFALDTVITQGQQRGRTIGIPTINLDLSTLQDHIFPADGVYAGSAVLASSIEHGESGSQTQTAGTPQPTYPAAISVGVKPTFGHHQLTIEAHLLGYSSDDPNGLYGHCVSLRFDRFLRDQYAFPGVDALVAQLHRDISRVEQLADSVIV